MITPPETAPMSYDGLPSALLARLSATATRWVDAGPIHGWTPVHSRFAKSVVSQGQRPRIIITRSENPPTEPAIQRWVDHQRLHVVPRPRRDAQGLVFWRLAIRQRAFAIDAYPRVDLANTIERANRLIGRASRLEVALGFFVGELVPLWVVHDKDEPVFLGLPDHHLVPTDDPTKSLAGILAAARVRPQVHEVVPAPRQAP